MAFEIAGLEFAVCVRFFCNHFPSFSAKFGHGFSQRLVSEVNISLSDTRSKLNGLLSHAPVSKITNDSLSSQTETVFHSECSADRAGFPRPSSVHCALVLLGGRSGG